jgi:hypothetical protein
MMAEVNIDNELVQSINLLISGAMSTGDQRYLPAILKAKTWLNIVIESNKAVEAETIDNKEESNDGST